MRIRNPGRLSAVLRPVLNHSRGKMIGGTRSMGHTGRILREPAIYEVDETNTKNTVKTYSKRGKINQRFKS